MSLEALWRLLEQQRLKQNVSMASVVGLDELKLDQEQGSSPRQGMTTIELVIVQGVLLAVLILLSVVWACCCKKRCIGDQNQFTTHIAAFARKLSTGSSRTMPPSYSKVDLTSVGLTLNDHLNPPPTYDRLVAMLESGEITSVPIHFHPEVERRMSLASSYTANNRSRRESNSSSRKSSKSSTDESRKSSRVTFAPNLIHGPGSSSNSSSRKASSQSLPLASVLHRERRKTSSKSEGSQPQSRKVSFIDELTGISSRPDPKFEQQLQVQLQIVKEAGELGEFVQKPSSPCENEDAAATTTTETPKTSQK